MMIRDYDELVRFGQVNSTDLNHKIYEQKKIIRNLKHQLGKRFDEKEVASIVGEVEDKYKAKCNIVMNELKKQDALMQTVALKYDSEKTRFNEISKGLSNVRKADHKMNQVNENYKIHLRRIVSHYCLTLSAVIFEWVRVTTAHSLYLKKEATLKSFTNSITLSSRGMQTILLGFEKFIDNFDKGRRINDLIQQYFNLKHKLIASINQKIYFEEFEKFERYLSQSTDFYNKIIDQGSEESSAFPTPNKMRLSLRNAQSLRKLEKKIYRDGRGLDASNLKTAR